MLPMLAIDPADPMLRMEPLDPMLRIEPAEPTLRIEPAENTDRMEPADRRDRIEVAMLPVAPDEGSDGKLRRRAATRVSMCPSSGTESGCWKFSVFLFLALDRAIQ